MEKTRVGIIGASGYAGGSLIQLLALHPQVEVTYATSRALVGQYVKNHIVNLRGVKSIRKLQFELPDTESMESKCDMVFLAMPHATSHKMVPEILDAGLKIVDLSADYRLKSADLYAQYYGEHASPDLLEKAVYGMPETHHDEITNANLVAVPGCHASSAIYSLLPLIQEDLIIPEKIIVDSKTGSTGAGAKSTDASHHPIRANSIRPYKMTGHRHTAEIEQELGRVCKNGTVTVGFSAHAANLTRGILSTAHAFLNDEKEIDERTVVKAYRKFYRKAPFVRFMMLKTGVFRLPDPKLIAGTNYVDVGFELDAHMPRIVALCALDNLIKGTAGNALQCMNLMAGYEETMGLEFPGLYPY